MLIEKILWNFSKIIYHNYLKMLIFIHNKECGNNEATSHYAIIMRVYLDREYNDRWIG